MNLDSIFRYWQKYFGWYGGSDQMIAVVPPLPCRRQTCRAEKALTPAPKYLWQIMIPLKDNDGVPFSDTHHECLWAMLRETSEGSTRNAVAVGDWMNEGKLYSESMIPVQFIETRAEAKRIARYVRKHYRQIEVMLFKIAKYDDIFFVREQQGTHAAPKQETS